MWKDVIGSELFNRETVVSTPVNVCVVVVYKLNRLRSGTATSTDSATNARPLNGADRNVRPLINGECELRLGVKGIFTIWHVIPFKEKKLADRAQIVGGTSHRYCCSPTSASWRSAIRICLC